VVATLGTAGTAAAISGTGSAVSGLTSLLGGSAASSGAAKAADTAGKEYYYTAQQENPYINAGYTTVDPQSALAQSVASQQGVSPYLSAATANMPASVLTQSQLEQTPGYQWSLGQGLRATQSAAAARGLGVSGASLKGAATYATGLADSTYANRYNEAQQTFTDWLNQNTSYRDNLTAAGNMLNQVSTLGQNAASATGTTGATDASTAATAYTNAGNATGSSITGVGNAINQGLQNYLSYSNYQKNTSPQTSPTQQASSYGTNNPNFTESGALKS